MEKLIYVKTILYGNLGGNSLFITLFPQNSVLENNQLEEEVAFMENNQLFQQQDYIIVWYMTFKIKTEFLILLWGEISKAIEI